MPTSATMIVYNEEELLPGCLAFLESMRNIREIIIIDTESTDRTWGILQRFAARTSKRLVLDRMPFTTFGECRNAALDKVTEDWVLIIDADETFTPQLDSLLTDLQALPKINAVRVPTLILYPDRRHYLHDSSTDPHVRLWRRGFARFVGTIHENQKDIHDRLLHECAEPDILTTYSVPRYHDVGMKHLQLLKSDAALAMKGLRWAQTGAIQNSVQHGIPVHPGTWIQWKKEAFLKHRIEPLPDRYYDITSDW